MRERCRFLVWGCAAVLSIGTPALAAWIPFGDLDATGWRSYIDDESPNWVETITIIAKPAADTLYIEIDKTFYDPMAGGGFSPIRIWFEKTDPQTAINRIVIADEVIGNETGSAWTDFHFYLDPVNEGDPVDQFSFDDSVGSPLALNFSDNDPAFSSGTYSGNDGYQNGPRAINFVDGWVDVGDAFRVSPTGPDIVIRTGPNATGFILREVPTPEPGTVLFLVGGAAVMFTVRKRSRRVLGVIVVCAGMFGATGVRTADAKLIPLGDSGWSAEAVAETSVSWIDTVGDTVRIEITKDFSGEPTVGTVWAPLQIRFKKTSAEAANRIVITSETVSNYTTSGWNQYHMVLAVPYSAQAQFITAPLPTVDHFSGVTFPDALKLDLQNGWVPVNDGFTAQNIAIDVTGFPVDRIFVLKEWPEVPEPVSLLLLAAGGGALARRRRPS